MLVTTVGSEVRSSHRPLTSIGADGRITDHRDAAEKAILLKVIAQTQSMTEVIG